MPVNLHNTDTGGRIMKEHLYGCVLAQHPVNVKVSGYGAKPCSWRIGCTVQYASWLGKPL